MAKVMAPNKEYTGITAGVSFVNGVGETDSPHLLGMLKEFGYEVEETPEPQKEKTLEKMTVDELKALAVEKGIDISAAKVKAEMLALIQEGLRGPTFN